MSDADDMDYEVSDEEKLAIARHLLVSSPPGQVDLVLDDLRKLVPEHLLTEEFLTSAYREHHLRTNSVLVQGGTKVIVAESTEVDAAHFVDETGREVVGVKHTERALDTTDSRALEDAGPAELQPFRDALQAAVRDHVCTFFLERNKSAATVTIRDGVLHVTISAERVELRNYWAGRYCTKWTVTPGGGSATLEGTSDLLSHYFENGNVQMSSQRAFAPQRVSFEAPEPFVSDVMSHIRAGEEAVLRALEEMRLRLNENAFKELRRAMPVSMTRMDWTGSAHALAKGMRAPK